MDTMPALSESDIKNFLAEALTAFQNNDAVTVERALSRVLEAKPENADALQLLGVLRRAQMRDSEAEELYRQSLAVAPAQPHVHHNLGNLYLAQNRLEESKAAQREAIRLKPDYVEALLNLGLACQRTGDFKAAEECFRRALSIQPNYAAAEQCLGALLNETERAKEAEFVLRKALSRGAHNPRQIAALEHNLGVSLSNQNRHAEALKLFDSAESKAPNVPAVDYNRANSYQALGLRDRALESYWRAIRKNPLDLLAHLDLNQLLYRMSDDANFLRSYDEAARVAPYAGQLPLGKAVFLLQKSDYEQAVMEFEKAAALLPQDVAPLDGLGMAFARLQRYPQAIHAHEAALKLEPENSGVWRNFAETLIRAGDFEKGLSAAEKSLAIEPDHQGTLAVWSTALRLVNDSRSEEINDSERLIQFFELSPPEGFSDMTSFNRELAAYLTGLHHDKREMIAQSLRGGTQTMHNLFGYGHDLVERLRVRIEEAIRSYIQHMREDQFHPLLKRRRAGFVFSGSWSTRLADCGFHTNHYHSKGWISSAYYVDLPEVVTNSNVQEGWIKFGEPAFETPLVKPIQRSIEPRVGSLVLFPSYMWHGTVPFRSSHPRMTIAFDAVPRE